MSYYRHVTLPNLYLYFRHTALLSFLPHLPPMEKNSFLYSSALKESKACCYSFPEQTFSEPTARSILVRLGSPRTTRAKSCELRSSSCICSVSGWPGLSCYYLYGNFHSQCIALWGTSAASSLARCAALKRFPQGLAMKVVLSSTL